MKAPSSFSKSKFETRCFQVRDELAPPYLGEIRGVEVHGDVMGLNLGRFQPRGFHNSDQIIPHIISINALRRFCFLLLELLNPRQSGGSRLVGPVCAGSPTSTSMRQFSIIGFSTRSEMLPLYMSGTCPTIVADPRCRRGAQADV